MLLMVSEYMRLTLIVDPLVSEYMMARVHLGANQKAKLDKWPTQFDGEGKMSVETKLSFDHLTNDAMKLLEVGECSLYHGK